MLGAILMIAGGSVAGSWGLWQMEHIRYLFSPVQSQARRRWRLSRTLTGYVAGSSIALGVLITGRVLALTGSAWFQICALAAILFVALAIVIPRWPQKVQARRIKAIHMALPAAIAQWRIEAQSRATLMAMLKRYVAVPRTERAALQAVVSTALELVTAGTTRVVIDDTTGQQIREPLIIGDALVLAAEQSGCQDLVSVASILAEADRSSGVVTAVEPLRRLGTLIERIIQAELDQLMARRALMLIAATAPAVIGALILILFVAAGSGALDAL